MSVAHSVKKIVVASNNAGKIEEIEAQLQGLSIELIPQSALQIPEIVEHGLTFVENAIIKARNACSYSKLPAFSDDSGLVVDSLNGAPGIYTSRYAGAHATDKENIAKLLAALKDVPEKERTARFYCVVAYLQHVKDPMPVICQGVWEGSILTEVRGEYGHGYDPVFYVPTHHCSAAQLPLSEKVKISHRSQAVQQWRMHIGC